MADDETESCRMGVREAGGESGAVVLCDCQSAAWESDATKAGRGVSTEWMG